MCRKISNAGRLLGIVIVVTLKLAVLSAQSFRSDEGPYQTVISNVTSCSSKEEWIKVNMTTYSSKGRNLLRGAIHFYNEVRDLKFRILVYYLEGKKVKVFDLKNQSCRNAILQVILKAFAVPFHKLTCKIAAGTYEFVGVNVDVIMHTVVQSLWYGAAQLRVETSLHAKMLACSDFYLKITKAQKDN